MTESLIPPLEVMETPEEVTETPGEATGSTNTGELLEVEKRLQKDEERYELCNRIYIGQPTKEEESNMDTDDSMYTFFR